MSMISRYQKAGGFIQLLQLIETCGKQKQENFLSIIEKESSAWANVIKQKMLSLDKIMSWDDNTVAEIFARVNELTLATALHGFSEENWAKISKTFSHLQKRRIEDLKNSKKPSTADISTAYVKILEEVRAMIKDGHLRVDKFAPELVLDENIEEKISRGELGGGVFDTSRKAQEVAAVSSDVTSEGTTLKFELNAQGAPAGSANDTGEIKDLRLKVQALYQENVALKNEIKVLKEKIGQIKKLAA